LVPLSHPTRGESFSHASVIAIAASIISILHDLSHSTIGPKSVGHFATMDRQRFYHTPSVSITVGSEDRQKTFHVHKDQLVHKSAYFRTSLESEFVEGRTQQVLLDQDDPDVFDVFVQWIYQGDYDVQMAIPKEEGGTEDAWYELHARAYSLGNRLIAPDFKKKVVEKLATIFERYDDLAMALVIKMAEIIYDGTSNEDGVEMRSLLAIYCGSRVGRQSPHQYRADRRRYFKKGELYELAHCDQQDFVADILCNVNAREQLNAEDTLRQLFS
jgi:hypothetical protein